jgi:hypothetical protein
MLHPSAASLAAGVSGEDSALESKPTGPSPPLPSRARNALPPHPANPLNHAIAATVNKLLNDNESKNTDLRMRWLPRQAKAR